MNQTTHYLLQRQAIQTAGQQDGTPFFCEHLTELNKSQKVTAREDICNRQGAIILKKGEDFSERRAQLIIQHKLIKPIEQCIELEGTYSPQQLYKYMKGFGSNVEGLRGITNSDAYQTSLKKMCEYYGQFPLIKQNLTVMATRLPNIYNNGIFTALSSLAIALQLQRSEKEQQLLFMAALLHDCGFLYLPHYLADKKDNFSAKEWHSLLAHPIIAKRFLDSVPHLPKEIGNIVIDHHERTDGTGFPGQKFGDELSIQSQIIGISDDIVTGYHAYKNYGDHTHHLILTALQLNDHLHFETVFKATAILFQKTAKANTQPILKITADELLQRHIYLQPHFESVRTLSRQLIAQTKHPLNRSIASMLGRLAISIVRAGLMQSEHEDWLREIIEGGEKNELALLEVAVMYDQIDAQLQHLKNLLARVIEDIPADQQTLKDMANSSYTAFQKDNPIATSQPA